MSNHLANETSPYLLQHRDNPVEWYPWGKQALERAEKENKPILLSIGYSACHWCHVMAHESFENPETASLMNEHFINIKVDREERPDLDQIYQNVAQAITRSGGWPLTVFLTPDQKPFFGGTYFPPQDQHGRPAFSKVLLALAHAFKEDPAGVAENAEKLTDFIKRLESISPSNSRLNSQDRIRPSLDSLKRIGESVLSEVDWRFGGVGGAPKFPNPMLFTFIWRLGVLSDFSRFRDATLLTLKQMAMGGIYDQLGGGFHRYSVDASWSIPHFEKMLYDNALLLKLYAEVLLTSHIHNSKGHLSEEDRSLFLETLIRTQDYVFREMVSPEGAFFSAQDADSEGEEGKYFAWDQADLKRFLTPEEAQAFALRYGVTEEGNFEEGKTVLFLESSIAEMTQQLEISEEEVLRRLASAQAKLLSARAKRVPPGLDHKILASWNGLMISGLIWTAQALYENGMESEAIATALAAKKAFKFVSTRMVQGEGRLFSTFQGGKGKENAYLDDYAFMAMAAIDLARFSRDPAEASEYLSFSRRWMDTLLTHFKDASAPGFFFTSDDHEVLIQRPKTLFDQAIPSGTAVALTCMTVLAEMDLLNGISRESDSHSEVEDQVSALFAMTERNPLGFGELLSLSLLHAVGPVTVTGSLAYKLCSTPYVFQKPAPKLTGAAKASPAIICHRHVCSSPLEDLATAEEAIRKIFKVH